jgi:hypothetical protein
MNAPSAKKTRLFAAALLATVPACLGACAGRFAPESDAASPLAPRVQALVDANRRYPRWEDFPAAPTGLPDPAQIAANVQGLEAQSGALGGEVARIDWTLGDAEALAAETRARVGAVPVSPDSARTAAEIEALARDLRERAKAPPPIDRRPPR